LALKLVASGLAFLGGGVGSIEGAMRDLFQTAKRRVTLCAYSFTTASDTLVALVEEALVEHVEIVLIINRYHEQPRSLRDWLERLGARFETLRIYSFEMPDGDLHAKLIVRDEDLAILGSSNLSRRGLLLNHELAVVSDQPAFLAECIRSLNSLLSKCVSIRDNQQ
jgi:cardiolipin synthase A/B